MTAVAANNAVTNSVPVNDTQFAEARRARAESAELEWSTGPQGIICTNPATEKAYIVTAGGTCTCPDHQYRGQTCKHVIKLRLHLIQTGGVL
jgi:predicted nucleic acid-binding Zn finger protein